MKYEQAKEQLLKDPKVREAYENPPESLKIARAVVDKRHELRMTQQELATKMGVSQAEVWRIESGHFSPTEKTLTKLGEALGVS